MEKQAIRKEGMRSGGEKDVTDAIVEVTYPYYEEVIANVPAGTAEHARKEVSSAAKYKP